MAYMIIWKDIPGYEGRYYASRCGCIGSRKKSGIVMLKPYPQNRGRLMVRLRGKDHQVHRLIAKTFLDDVEGKDQINHKNGDYQGNREINLEWCTCYENIRHKIEVLGKNHIGENNPGSTLNEQAVKVIKYFLKKGRSGNSIAKAYGVTRQTIYNIKSGKTWPNVEVNI